MADAANLCGVIRSGAHDIEVVGSVRDDLHEQRETQGCWDVLQNRITIPDEACDSRKVEILFHELTHVWLQRFQFEDKTEEALALHFGEQLAAFVRMNPGYLLMLIQRICNGDMEAP